MSQEPFTGYGFVCPFGLLMVNACIWITIFLGIRLDFVHVCEIGYWFLQPFTVLQLRHMKLVQVRLHHHNTTYYRVFICMTWFRANVLIKQTNWSFYEWFYQSRVARGEPNYMVLWPWTLIFSKKRQRQNISGPGNPQEKQVQ